MATGVVIGVAGWLAVSLFDAVVAVSMVGFWRLVLA